MFVECETSKNHEHVHLTLQGKLWHCDMVSSISNAHARAMYFADPPSIFLPFQPQNCHVGQILQDPVRELLHLVLSDVQFCPVGQTLEDLVREGCESVVVEVQSGEVGQALEDLVWELCEFVAGDAQSWSGWTSLGRPGLGAL